MQRIPMAGQDNHAAVMQSRTHAVERTHWADSVCTTSTTCAALEPVGSPVEGGKITKPVDTSLHHTGTLVGPASSARRKDPRELRGCVP